MHVQCAFDPDFLTIRYLFCLGVLSSACLTAARNAHRNFGLSMPIKAISSILSLIEIQRKLSFPSDHLSYVINSCKRTLLLNDYLSYSTITCKRPPWKATTLEGDHPGRRPPWKATTLEGDHPGRRPPWKATTLEGDHLS